jgi:hypothetical protein
MEHAQFFQNTMEFCKALFKLGTNALHFIGGIFRVNEIEYKIIKL